MENKDLILKINTSGIDETKEDFHHNRYEPTPYEVIEKLIESGYITKENIFVDYGCGKGRVALYMNKEVGCHAIGIDFNQELIDIANQNNKQLSSSVDFKCMKAEDYIITNEDCFYFFNPFSENILRRVMNHIIASIYENPRSVTLFFYYPEDDDMAYMMNLDAFICIDEIYCNDLYDYKDDRERIVVFESLID